MPRRRRRERPVEPPPEPPQRSDDESPEQMYRRVREYVDALLAWQERTGLYVWRSWGLPQKEDWEDGDVITEAEFMRRSRSYWRS